VRNADRILVGNLFEIEKLNNREASLTVLFIVCKVNLRLNLNIDHSWSLLYPSLFATNDRDTIFNPNSEIHTVTKNSGTFD
jgi:hypothetical protein